MSAFYVTTPIYYVNDRPHIGTAYSTIVADVLARFHRLRGEPTRFLTGLDEHGLKLERRARELGMEPQAFVDSMVPPFKDAWTQLACAYDDFIRTTEPRHKDRVQALWERCLARLGPDGKPDIYEADYEGLYCVGCEAYYTDKDLLEGRCCPIHKKPVEVLSERTYFFRLSAYTDKLLAFFDANPKFVQPEGRFNEVKSFVREGLKDISISRSTFSWGVKVPNDPKHIMYVWFDALTNYMSALGGPERQGETSALFEEFWTPSAHVLHIVGKDILRFHAIYWPAFLLSAGLTPPSQIWAHGWLTVNGQKMSKSLGNFIAPGPIVEELDKHGGHGEDVLRYYLMRDVAFGQDGDFSHASLFARYHGELGNGLGNLLNRMVASIVKTGCAGKVPSVRRESDGSIDLGSLSELDRALIAKAEASAAQAAALLEAVQPSRALEAVFELVAAANKYVDQVAPWNLVKVVKGLYGAEGDEDAIAAKMLETTGRLHNVVYTVLETLRFLGVMLWPYMPSKCDALLGQLGLAPLAPSPGQSHWPERFGVLPAGLDTRPGAPLFPRLDKDQERAVIDRLAPKVTEPAMDTPPADKPAADPKPAKPAAPAQARDLSEKPAATIDDFGKLDLRVGEVKSAERVPKSDKLLKLQVDLGPLGTRQILAGIGKHYTPEALVGKHIAVLANLPPRKMMGLESQGMVLAAGDGDVLSVMSPVADVPVGSTIA
jgi:methionyl-tRNA synthetase